MRGVFLYETIDTYPVFGHLQRASETLAEFVSSRKDTNDENGGVGVSTRFLQQPACHVSL